jgi:hypothetical protein
MPSTAEQRATKATKKFPSRIMQKVYKVGNVLLKEWIFNSDPKDIIYFSSDIYRHGGNMR